MLGVPDVQKELKDFKKELQPIRQLGEVVTELKSIRQLLEKLLELEEAKSE